MRLYRSERHGHVVALYFNPPICGTDNMQGCKLYAAQLPQCVFRKSFLAMVRPSRRQLKRLPEEYLPQTVKAGKFGNWVTKPVIVAIRPIVIARRIKDTIGN